MARIKRYGERRHTMNVFSESKTAQILCLFFLFTFFGIRPSAAQLQQKKEAQFTVGMILPLSGRAAEYGIAVRNGVELAKKNSPLLFNNIRFVFEDSLYDGKTSITAYNKITAVEKADLVLVWGHGPVQAVVPVAEIKQQPLMVISGQRDVANGKDYTIRFCSPHDAYAGALLRHIKKLGYGKIAVVKTEMGFLNDTVEALNNSIKEPGMLSWLIIFSQVRMIFSHLLQN
jgi:ABC-type branched-subunit amino acid transport system substrate-binding protein